MLTVRGGHLEPHRLPGPRRGPHEQRRLPLLLQVVPRPAARGAGSVVCPPVVVRPELAEYTRGGGDEELAGVGYLDHERVTRAGLVLRRVDRPIPRDGPVGNHLVVRRRLRGVVHEEGHGVVRHGRSVVGARRGGVRVLAALTRSHEARVRRRRPGKAREDRDGGERGEVHGSHRPRERCSA